MPLVGLRITKLLIRPMKPVQHAIALIKPGEKDKLRRLDRNNRALPHTFCSLFIIFSRNNSKPWSFLPLTEFSVFSLLYCRRRYYSSSERGLNLCIKTLQRRSRNKCLHMQNNAIIKLTPHLNQICLTLPNKMSVQNVF